jgi:hypothetical protein
MEGHGMNKALLRSVMIAHGDTQAILAREMGLSLSRLNAKINGSYADFRQTEIGFIRDRYKLGPEDVNAIFFNSNVS